MPEGLTDGWLRDAESMATCILWKDERYLGTQVHLCYCSATQALRHSATQALCTQEPPTCQTCKQTNHIPHVLMIYLTCLSYTYTSRV